MKSKNQEKIAPGYRNTPNSGDRAVYLRSTCCHQCRSVQKNNSFDLLELLSDRSTFVDLSHIRYRHNILSRAQQMTTELIDFRNKFRKILSR